jgi:signal transduction histidine kinase
VKIKRLSLQIRIFLSILLVVIIASVSIIVVTVFQYRKQAHDYHIKRLERKENAIKRDIAYELLNTTWIVETGKLSGIFRDKIYEIADVHGMEVSLYDLQGRLLKTSHASFIKDSTQKKPIPLEVIENLKENVDHRIVKDMVFDGKPFKSSYSYIYDNKFTPIGVLNISYLEESKFYQSELSNFLTRIIIVFVFVFLLAIAVAYFLSRYITHSIKTVIDKMNETRFTGQNEKIELDGGSEEIHNLVNAFNGMIDQLEESAVKLARSERELAWREMAKQVAHEIKNPLTPMRLTIQSFQRKFDPADPQAKEKLSEFSHTIIQSIDTMSSIASAFSDFAKMPTAKKEPLNVVDVVKHAVDIFSETYISFFSERESIIAHLDKTQLIRVITNLVTNANQALVNVAQPKIEVKIREESKYVEISVADNGKGIADDVKDKVFEPKFTTKTSGMGLGLPMVKNIVEAYGGNISFISEEGKGTVFTVSFPKD